MGKDKSGNPSNPPKKELSLSDSQVSVKEMETKVKKKRTHVEVEMAPEQIPLVTNNDVKKMKKDKKHKKKRLKEETQTKQTEIPDESSCPEATLELNAEKDLSPEEKRVLERKMKKILKKEEKKRLKDAQNTEKTEAAGPTASQQALDYLVCWADNRSEWRFQKTRQTWLLQHMFQSDEIQDDKFVVLMQYLEGLRGMAKDTTVQKALSLVEESGKAPEDAVVQQRAHRAREVIQLFS